MNIGMKIFCLGWVPSSMSYHRTCLARFPTHSCSQVPMIGHKARPTGPPTNTSYITLDTPSWLSGQTSIHHLLHLPWFHTFLHPWVFSPSQGPQLLLFKTTNAKKLELTSPFVLKHFSVFRFILGSFSILSIRTIPLASSKTLLYLIMTPTYNVCYCCYNRRCLSS